MMKPLSRRALLAMSATLPLAAVAGVGTQANVAPGRPSSNRLVAYFTRSGNTRVIAGSIHRALVADLFEIRPARPYPEDYDETVAQATRERDRGYEPPLEPGAPDVGAYDTVFLGFPIWGGTASPPIRSFLRAHDFSGKTIRPFITHGGYGLGNSLKVLADHAPSAQIEPPFVMEADQERRTLDQVKRWLGEIAPS